MDLLLSIPGIQVITAAAILGEIGCDMSRFPSAKHLASWAGVCPGNHESAGKRPAGRSTQGNPYFRATLNQSAWAGSHTKGSAFQARYRHFHPKLHHQGAIIAVAHALVYAIYNVLAYQRPYREVATAELGQAKAARLIRHHQSRIQHLRAFLKHPPRPDLAHLLSRSNAEV